MSNWKNLSIPFPVDFILPDSMIVYGTELPANISLPENCLSEEEIRKYNRLKNKAQSDLQKACRSVLKFILATYTGRNVNDISLKTNKFGKPYLENGNIFFNISHTDTAFIMYISRLGRTGVDMESNSFGWNFQLLSEYAFTAEERKRIITRSDFFHYWTMKEALLKASGFGLINHLSETDSLKIISDYQLFSHSFICPGNETATIVSKHSVGKECYFEIS